MPWGDWSAVVTGEKRQFRQPARNVPLALLHAPTPSPVVAFTDARRGGIQRQTLMVLEGFRHEPLGAISPGDLELEGYPSIKEFRAYWNARFKHSRGFDPLAKVAVISVRPWVPADREEMAERILDHLYGEEVWQR